MMSVSLFILDGAVARDSIPLPEMSEAARELLAAMLAHALWSSPGLRCLEHRARSLGMQDPSLEPLLDEIRKARYPMQWEGVDASIATMADVRVQEGDLVFTLNAVFAAFLVATGAGDHVVRDPRPRRRELPALDDDECGLVLEGLRLLCELRGLVWNFHAAHALGARLPLVEPAAFGLRDAEALVTKLEGSASPRA